jgi:hypothetical protein
MPKVSQVLGKFWRDDTVRIKAQTSITHVSKIEPIPFKPSGYVWPNIEKNAKAPKAKKAGDGQDTSCCVSDPFEALRNRLLKDPDLLADLRRFRDSKMFVFQRAVSG